MKRTLDSARPFFITFLFLCTSIFQLNAQNSGTRKALMAFEKAQDYFQNGEWVQCESELKKAIIADSTLADPYIMLGDVYLETERPEDAVVQYKKSLKLNPKRVEIVYNLLANTLYSLERYGEAVEYYEDMLNVQGLDQEL